ncbi:MAG TPA: hypothetical protein VI197_07495 [Polyangiaceae bacterium]
MRTLACLTAILALSATGCGTCDTGGQQPIEYNGGTNNLVEGESPPESRVYETSPPFGEYLHFPAGRRFDLMHELGVAPHSVQGFLSFERVPGEGSGDDNTGNFAPAAGNQLVTECIDEERVRVRNDTCAETYLRVVLLADGVSTPPAKPCQGVKTD